MARTVTGLSSINFTHAGQADQGARRAASTELPTCEFGRRRTSPCRRHIDTRAHIRKIPLPAPLAVEGYFSGRLLQPPGMLEGVVIAINSVTDFLSGRAGRIDKGSPAPLGPAARNRDYGDADG